MIGVAIVSREDVAKATQALNEQKIDALEKQLESANARARNATEAKAAEDGLLA